MFVPRVPIVVAMDDGSWVMCHVTSNVRGIRNRAGAGQGSKLKGRLESMTVGDPYSGRLHAYSMQSITFSGVHEMKFEIPQQQLVLSCRNEDQPRMMLAVLLWYDERCQGDILPPLTRAHLSYCVRLWEA